MAFGWQRWRQDLIAGLVGAELTLVSIIVAFQWYCVIEEGHRHGEMLRRSQERRQKIADQPLGILKEEITRPQPRQETQSRNR